MRRLAIFPLLGPALVLYLIADVASLHGELDALGYGIAALSVWLSWSIVGSAARSEERSARLVAWLGLCGSLVLVPLLTDEQPRLSVELAQTVGLAMLAALVLQLALGVPDRVLSPRITTLAQGSTLVLAVGSAALSTLAQGPVFAPLGTPWLLPAPYAHAVSVFAGGAVLAALALRLARRRLGSGPEALASNHWAVLALLPGAALCVVLVVLQLLDGASSSLVRVLGALSVLSLYLGHLWLIDPARRLSASRTTRDLVAGGLTVSLVVLGIVASRSYIPHDAAALAVWAAATLLLAFALFYALRPLSQRVLAPAGGALLEQLQWLQRAMGGAHTLEGLTAVVLLAFRRAAGGADAQPLFYGFDPAFEGRIDAAGEAHLADRPLSAAIAQHLREQPSEIIVRAPLETRIVREPPLRPLIEALVALDALCVLPLVSDGELEGALVVPRGPRRAQLSLEELAALRDHGRWLSGFLNVFAAQRRAEARAHALLMEQHRSEGRLEHLADEAARLRADIESLYAAGSARGQSAPLLAYSAAMRALVERLRPLCAHEVPVLFVAESGVPVEPLARFLHAESARAAEPFLVLDCAALKTEEASVVLFGGTHAGVRHAGALRLAAAGTLLLGDVVALPIEAQRLLVAALASRTGRPVDGGESYALTGRVVASARASLETLVETGACDAELAARLCTLSCRVPPLRERREDIGSHALLAVDRACRRLGRQAVGFEPEALEQLTALELVGNVNELEELVERAVARCRGQRISVADLALSQSGVSRVAADALEGTLEEVECRVLQHALARAGGNKSEGARLLGLPRTTFLDKLRRHKLDDSARESSTPPN